MASNFSTDDSKEKLIAGLGVFLNPETFLGNRQVSIFDEQDVEHLKEFPQSLLFKLAESAEACHNEAISWVNMTAAGQ